MKRIRKSFVAANTVGASSSDANRQLIYPSAVDRLVVSVLPISGTPLCSVAISLVDANTGSGTFAAPAANDVVANFAPGVDQVYVFDLLTPASRFKVTTANNAAANVIVYVTGMLTADP